MFGIFGAEISVSVEIVAEEAHSAFERHKLRGEGEILYLRVGQALARSRKVALGVDFIELNVEAHLAEILLVLCGGACAEADAVAEIVERKTGHDGVEVDNADALVRLVVKHDVVELRVVVCDSQRELAALEHIYENARVALAREDEVYLLAHARRASLEVVVDCLFEVGEA